MLYAATKNMSKTANYVIYNGLVWGAAAATFAYFRYTGPDNGGALPGEPKTTSAEWAAATVEYGKAQKANPIRHFKD